MKFFTYDEAKRIIENSSMGLCLNSETNPNRGAMQALVELSGQQGQPFRAAVNGFLLGRATGIREERARKSQHHT